MDNPVSGSGDITSFQLCCHHQYIRLIRLMVSRKDEATLELFGVLGTNGLGDRLESSKRAVVSCQLPTGKPSGTGRRPDILC